MRGMNSGNEHLFHNDRQLLLGEDVQQLPAEHRAKAPGSKLLAQPDVFLRSA